MVWKPSGSFKIIVIVQKKGHQLILSEYKAKCDAMELEIVDLRHLLSQTENFCSGQPGIFDVNPYSAFVECQCAVPRQWRESDKCLDTLQEDGGQGVRRVTGM